MIIWSASSKVEYQVNAVHPPSSPHPAVVLHSGSSSWMFQITNAPQSQTSGRLQKWDRVELYGTRWKGGPSLSATLSCTPVVSMERQWRASVGTYKIDYINASLWIQKDKTCLFAWFLRLQVWWVWCVALSLSPRWKKKEIFIECSFHGHCELLWTTGKNATLIIITCE